MTEHDFVKKHQATWRRLSELEKLLFSRKSKVTSDIADDFLTYYRDASHDLAYVRTHFPGSKTEVYLNQLIATCHTRLYKRESITLAVKGRGFYFLWRGELVNV